MEKMIDLKDLLKHEIQDLYSAEEQIIEALPEMVEKARNPELKKALREHHKITEQQKKRLDKVKQLLGDEDEDSGGEQSGGFFSNLFGGGEAGHKCKGMEGLIKEGQKIMGLDMTEEVSDAAIIAAAQKIEHYEICGYGTAKAYARELDLGEVAELLEDTLNEEYEADDRLTDLAVGGLNEEAQEAKEDGNGTSRSRRPQASTNGRGSSVRGTVKSNNTKAKSSSGGNDKSSNAKKVSSSQKSSSSRGNSSGNKSRSGGKQKKSAAGKKSARSR